MGVILRLQEGIDQARGHLLPFGVVALGVGIGVYFSWPHEPRLWAYFCALMLLGLSLWCKPNAQPISALMFMAVLGFLLAGGRAHWVEAPILSFRYYGPIEGRVIEIDRSGSDALRITLDRVTLRGIPLEKLPKKVRISLHGPQFIAPEAGRYVMVTGHLSPPMGPAEPGGFDFRRMAYFERLGAVGYSRNPMMTLAPARAGEEWIARLRMYLSDRVRSHISGEAGAFAAGAVTGDRSGITQATVEALRDSSLAHILAISGMNMAFLCGFVFAFLRRGLALIPWLALRVNTKKLSALVSLGVAWFYLLLSGGNVATERAFVMLCVMMGAVLLDRRAITLRSAALAAGVQLMMRPEALLQPGFQMSTAATIALIAGFRAMEGRSWPRFVAPLVTLMLSSLIGGFASGPFAAYHFNRFADYGLLANILTVPAMGILIMPMAALAVLLAPFGLAFIPLYFMGLGAEWTLFIAYWVAGFGGAVTGIVKPAPWVLALFSLAGLWIILWPLRGRWLGLIPMVFALGLWAMSNRPSLLIESEGRVVGLMTLQGRAISQPKTGGFSVENWLENDGDLQGQAIAAQRDGFFGPKEARSFTFEGLKVTVLSGQKGIGLLEKACSEADLVILAARAEAPEGCVLLDQKTLAQTGSIAIENGKITYANQKSRLWDGAQIAPQSLAALGDLIGKSGSARPDAPEP